MAVRTSGMSKHPYLNLHGHYTRLTEREAAWANTPANGSSREEADRG